MPPNETSAALAELAYPAGLASALERALDGAAKRRAFAGVRVGGEVATAFVSDRVSKTEPPEASMRVGCLAKVLTAALAGRVLARAGIDVATPLTSLLDVGSARPRFEETTLRQLLEHTHGLDDSLLEGPLLHDDKSIDAPELARRAMEHPPLAEPGAIYSYGNVGPWLVAAALERVARRSYAELLRDELLAPLGVAMDARDACAATGGDLALTARDWLVILTTAVTISPLRAEIDEAREPVTPLPGWNPLERGVRRGWKYYGGGWFGHQSVWPGSSALVRAHAQRDIQLVVASEEHAAPVIAARVFARALPELFELRMPEPQRFAALCGLRSCVGAYGSARWRAEVRFTDGLELLVHDKLRGVRRCAELASAGGGAFFVCGETIESFPYVELVAPGGGGAAYLWNGRSVLRRL